MYFMDINDLLNKNIVEFLTTHYDPHYVKRLQTIAEVNKVVNTPYFEECVQGFQSIDPYNKLQSDYEILRTLIDTEKNELIRCLRNMNSDSQIYEKIKEFHDKKDKLCETILHELEYRLEYQLSKSLIKW